MTGDDLPTHFNKENIMCLFRKDKDGELRHRRPHMEQMCRDIHKEAENAK